MHRCCQHAAKNAPQLVAVSAAPESPVWLLWAGHTEAAMAVATRLHGHAGNVRPSGRPHDALLFDEEHARALEEEQVCLTCLLTAFDHV